MTEAERPLPHEREPASLAEVYARSLSTAPPDDPEDRLYDACMAAVEWVAMSDEPNCDQALIYEDGSCMLLSSRRGRAMSLAERLRAVGAWRPETLRRLLNQPGRACVSLLWLRSLNCSIQVMAAAVRV